jgi:glycosyltransferase involved in cell wall biosynthesis
MMTPGRSHQHGRQGVPEVNPSRHLHLLLPFPVLGAAENYGRTIAEGMARRGWRVTLGHSFQISPSIDGELVRRSPLDTESLVAVTRWVAKERPHLLHVNQVFLPALGAARLGRIHPLVVTAHTPALESRSSRRGRALQAIARGGVDRWIVLSDRNRELMAASRGLGPGATSVIFPGLPVEQFRDLPSAAAARHQIALESGSITIGAVGRLSQQKRHDVLIEAVALASRQLPELRLVIVGEGELEATTRRLAQERIPGQVTFTGYRADAIELLPAFDIFAMSSDFEGLPFALLEAMATGRPIVTTDVQGAGEAVRHGREGLVVPRRDPTALAEATLTLARDRELAARLGAAARERFLAEFTADRMIDRTEALYLELLAERGRA